MVGIEELVAFLRKSENPDLLMAADWVQDHPQAVGTQKALKLATRILGHQARSSETRSALVDKVTRKLFYRINRQERQWVHGMVGHWIRNINHDNYKPLIGTIDDISGSWQRESIKGFIKDYLRVMLQKHGEELYLLISTNKGASNVRPT